MAKFQPKKAGPRSIRSLFHWAWNALVEVGSFIGDEGDSTPPDPVPDPGHQHWHDNIVNVTPNQHHLQLHDIDSHTDATILDPKEGQGIWFNVDAGGFLNRGPVNEAFPTGLADGGEMNIAPTANDVEVVGPGIALILDSYTDALAPPAIIGLSWDTFNVPITIAPPSAGSVVWISLANSGVPDAPFGGINVFEAEIRQYNTPPTPTLARQEVFLGVLVHNGTFWKEVSNPKVINQTAETLREFVITVFGPSYIIDGGGVSELASFQLEQQSGTIWENNRNWHVDKSDPNREALPARSPLSFQYVNRDYTDVGAVTSTIDPAQWDNAGTVEAIGGAANNATIQRLYMDPADNFWILWGQTIYPNFLTAQANLPAESIEVPFILQNSILLGYIITERVKTDWDINEAVFIAVAGAGGVGGGGTPITDHANLNGILPDDHHSQTHLLYGTDHTDVAVGDTLVTGSVLTYVESADGGSDKFIPINAFVAAGYGGITQSVPVVLPSLGPSWEVVPADSAALSTPSGVTQDFANNGIRFESRGIWSVNIVISLSHDESNSGREIEIQIYNATDDIEGGGTVIPIARNQPGTFISLVLLLEVPATSEDDLYQVRIGNVDTVTGIVLNSYQFGAAHVSEFKG